MTDDAVGRTALRKITVRLVPYLFALYVVAYLDRVNVSFASLQMNADLGFSDTVFGFGSGLFFVGYMLFQIPSNLLLMRVGARRLIASLMLVWGCLSVGMMFTRGELSFYALRFLLGLAEAGFFPGVILYLTMWFPARTRARTVSLFMTATAVAGILGGPISGAILTMEGTHGLAGWHWLFLLEGIPAVLLGVSTWHYLTDRPSEARWLTPEEKDWLHAQLSDERERAPDGAAGSLVDALESGRVWLLSFIYFCLVCSMYSVTLWMPQIVKGFSASSDLVVGLLTAIPYSAAAIGMVAVGHHSDQTGERHWHVFVPAMVSACGLVMTGTVTRPDLALLALSLAALGLWGTVGPFWTLPPAVLRGSGTAVGIALVNSLGNLGGFVGPLLVGWLKDVTHHFSAGLYGLAGLLVIGAFLTLGLRTTESGRKPP
ncbi:MAG: MFS transporter [Candidatus Eremiobacterota bacterium]